MLGQTHKGLPDTASSQLFSENVASEDDNYVKALIRAGLTPDEAVVPFGKKVCFQKQWEMQNVLCSMLLREPQA